MRKVLLLFLTIIFSVAITIFVLVSCDTNHNDLQDLSNSTIFTVQENRITGLTEYGKTFTELVIPESIDEVDITSIGEAAFASCENLTQITISENIKIIDKSAFINCKSLTNIIIPESVEKIGGYAFYNCISLTSITIFGSSINIGERAFAGCFKLVEIISNLDIEKGSYENGWIGVYAITIHTGESEIVEKSGYQFITDKGKNYLIGYNGDNTSLVLPNDFNGESYNIYKYAFSEKSTLKNVIISNNVLSIGKNSFANCTSLKEINVPVSVKTIEDCAFFHCESLTNAVLGDGLISLGKQAFSDCYILKNIILGKNLTEIGELAFLSCYKLVEIINYSQLEIEIGSYDNGWIGFEALIVHQGNSKIVEVDGNQFITVDGINYLFGCTTQKEELVLPNDYNGERYKINKNAFYGCEYLKNVIFNNNITEIGESAFANCKLLTEITIPNGVIIIGKWAFFNCSSLQKVTLPNGITDIKDYTFSNCTSLSRIYYSGSTLQWNGIIKGFAWKDKVPATIVHCVDDDVKI